MNYDKKKTNIYFTTAVIVTGLLFMIITGYFIMGNIKNTSSLDIATDQRIDACYKEKGLE